VGNLNGAKWQLIQNHRTIIHAYFFDGLAGFLFHQCKRTIHPCNYWKQLQGIRSQNIFGSPQQSARIGETRGKMVGHYTQMVWSSTREVGAGVAHCPSGAIIVVASYHPAGNMVGSVPY